MTTPAEVSAASDWDRLITTLRAQYRDVDDLYQRIHDADQETDQENQPSPEEPMNHPDINRYTGHDLDADDRAAELAEEEQTRRDFESDGQLDGDYEADPGDEPGLED